MRIGFIGCGNMGSALARSVMKSVSAFHIVINDVNTHMLFLKLFSIIGCYKILAIVPYAIW